MASRSRFALEEVLTRKAILHAQLFKHFFGRLCPSSFHILVAISNAFDGLLKVQPFPLQSIGQHFVERNGRFLPVTLGIIVELGLPFG